MLNTYYAPGPGVTTGMHRNCLPLSGEGDILDQREQSTDHKHLTVSPVILLVSQSQLPMSSDFVPGAVPEENEAILHFSDSPISRF